VDDGRHRAGGIFQNDKCGVDISRSANRRITYALSHLECRPILLDGMGGMLREQISRIKACDIVVSISFSPYAEETVMVSKTAASVGARQIVITDSQISPLATFSDLCFVVKEAQVDAFRSQSATLCLVQSLVVALAYRLGDKKHNNTQENSNQ
ncbi:TPA: MurR/RpiR family transcriptional regulator, partial [Escherichia coli]